LFTWPYESLIALFSPHYHLSAVIRFLASPLPFVFWKNYIKQNRFYPAYTT